MSIKPRPRHSRPAPGSSAPAEVALGTVDGVDYTLALDAGFGTEQFIENLSATIVPEPSSALLLGLGYGQSRTDWTRFEP
jgi:hypothetical protein